MRSLSVRLSPRRQPSSIVLLILAFAAVYLIWGSTYLAILYAIESFPPFLMLGIRFGLAGVLMYAVLRQRGHARPTMDQVRSACIMGVLLLFVGTGSIAWAEAHIPSGLAALLVATVPLWIVALEWLWLKGPRPTWKILLALATGMTGVAIVAQPPAHIDGGSVYYVAIGVSLLGAISWSYGSLLGRRMELPKSPFMTAALQMMGGGLVLSLLGTATGELSAFSIADITLHSTLAVLYLFFFGSLVAFSAFVWLMDHVAPARVATYAFVNPIVAVLLGTFIAGEPLTLRIGLAGAMLVTAVVIIVRSGKRVPAGRPSRLERQLKKRRRDVAMAISVSERHPQVSRTRFTTPLSRRPRAQ